MKIVFMKTAVLILLIAMFLLSCSDNDSEVDGIPEELAQDVSEHINIILIIIDTLRADHLSCYGYHRLTSPTIDSLAAAGTIWVNAQAQAPWTLPAHASIWTGLTVRSHRTETNRNWIRSDSSGKNYALDENLLSIPVLLSEAGFSTCGIANVCLLGDIYGFDNGFNNYSCNSAGHGMAAVSVDSLIVWLEENSMERFFCMLHLYDVHDPYDPPSPYNALFDTENSGEATVWEVEDGLLLNPEDRDHLVGQYDGEIAWVDDNLRTLFAWLRSRNLNENTLIIVTSDHGEEFLDHGWVDHGHTLYQELVHIPLIIAGPGISEGFVDSSFVGQFDILPTMISWAGVDCNGQFEGVNILTDDLTGDRVIPASGVVPVPWSTGGHLASVASNSRKTIGMSDLETFITFDLNMDPGEEHSLPADSLGVEEVLYYWATPQRGYPVFAMPGQVEVNALRNLGYIND
ncbi:MAG: sulfatase [Candidatus Aegiribacteria sp.]|nr:sulfatase [Candidatus Aegiribacteria sp.]